MYFGVSAAAERFLDTTLRTLIQAGANVQVFLARVHISVFGGKLKWHCECLELLQVWVSFKPAADSLQLCESQSSQGRLWFQVRMEMEKEGGNCGGCRWL